ncbi:MAG TPA: hypothetical protein DEF82_09210 [Crocinitomicaceae bacterium]|nr:hypothetical protein [Crocinitomicaceae bacterium]
MKLFFSFVVISIASTSIFAQNIKSTPIGTPEILYNENGVTISSQMTECYNKDRKETMNFKLLSIVNNSTTPATLKVRCDSYYDGKCYTCENDEYTFTFNIAVNETKSGTCDSNPSLQVFYSMKDGYIKEVLTDFKMNVVRLH